MLTLQPLHGRVTMLPPPSPTLEGVERTRESLRERRSLVRLDRNERLAPLPASFLASIREALAVQHRLGGVRPVSVQATGER